MKGPTQARCRTSPEPCPAPGWRACLLAACGMVVLAGCRDSRQLVVPNRVLDRPTDMALTCVQLEEDGTITPLGLGSCDDDGPAASCFTVAVPQLIGYIANSERNEIAMFRRCDSTAGIVDLDQDAPGYQLIPAGQLPTKIVATEGGCRVVTANVGSCDLTVLDAVSFGAYALDVPPLTAPSSLVSTLTVLRADGEPLSARPGELLAVPSELSSADIDVGLDGIDGLGGRCSADDAESLWMTFPSCQLVAEVSLLTGQVLQSRKIVRDEDGDIVLEDAGTNPQCPVECPIQFDGTVPPPCDEDITQNCREVVDPDGYFPVSLAFVEPISSDDEDSIRADQEILYPSLFMGGLGSDTLVELQFEPDRERSGGFSPSWVAAGTEASLKLEGAGGVHAIRPTPPVDMFGAGHQFLYVIAGDGSTHVVDRTFAAGQLGVECDTQVDSSALGSLAACNVLDPDNVSGIAPDRRPFAVGPGLRAVDGQAITDWTFIRLDSEDFQGDSGQIGSEGTPFGRTGVTGVGVTSFGSVVLGAFDQFRSRNLLTGDPTGVMDTTVTPHSLWPAISPYALANDGVSPLSAGLPVVEDATTNRALPGAQDTSQTLSPSVRKIDFAYTTIAEASDERSALAAALGNIPNTDQLGLGENGGAIYRADAPKIIAREYQSWRSINWSLIWEGSIAGTRSTSGRIECDTPGWEQGTCIVGAPSDEDPNPGDNARLVDEAAAFCDDGVLAGDKIVLLGCIEDGDCGLGQRCLTEPTARGNASGICISAEAYEREFDVLRQVCAPFITNPCGAPVREFLVTRAFQTELHLQALNIPATTHLRAQQGDTEIWAPDESAVGGRFEATMGPVPTETTASYTCELPAAPMQPEQGCANDDECSSLNGGDFVCTNDGYCRGSCPTGTDSCYECINDTDCGHYGEGAICSGELCMRPCEPGQRDCVQSLLPGPRCFAEFVDYVVRTRNSFTVQGGNTAPFLSDAVVTDPDSNECGLDPSVSTLLTSRIRLDDASLAAMPDCANEDGASPFDPNPCWITTPRTEGNLARFHLMSYRNEVVRALRFSNPLLSLTLDLTDLQALAGPVDLVDAEGTRSTGLHPSQAGEFNRARIPRGYREEFSTAPGYVPMRVTVSSGTLPLIYPVRIIPGADPFAAYIVDSGGRGGPAGIRGQILRILPLLVDSNGQNDPSFQVR